MDETILGRMVTPDAAEALTGHYRGVRRGVEDCDNYAEKGMRARIAAIRGRDDDHLVVTFDFTELSEANALIENATITLWLRCLA